MQAVIILSIGTAAALFGAARSSSEDSKTSYLITAVVFLILISSHVIFNPTF